MNLKGRNKINSEFNMSSMTDVVFMLLIFFMLTSTLVTVNAIDVILPKASGKTENKKSISVSIKNNSSFYIDKTKVNVSKLEESIKDLMEKQQGEATIVIRADKDVTYDNVIKVIDIANRNKYKMILAVKGGK